jgi:hypothetical protein
MLPSSIPEKKGAVVRFIVPGSEVEPKDPDWVALARNCSAGVEKASFRGITRDDGKEQGTLATIAYHYAPSDEAPPGDAAEVTGRLIAERLVGLLSFALGERMRAIQQQVHRLGDEGRLQVHAHPSQKHVGGRRIDLPERLFAVKPSEDVFKALYWARRGVDEGDHLSAYAANMVALEILSGVLATPESKVQTCPHCGAEIGRRATAPVKSLVVDLLGCSSEVFGRMWKARNAIVVHGGQPVTARVLHDIVELKLEAIRLVFKALRLAMDFEPDGSPHPSPALMMTDPFLGAD